VELLDGERDWIAAVVADPLDLQRKLVYADWLEERGSPRAGFVRAFAAALRSKAPRDFPEPQGMPEGWRELLGYRLAKAFAGNALPDLIEPVLRLARPALRLEKVEQADADIPVGASKVGGAPDLPAETPWPAGQECRAIYNQDTAGAKRLAGFLAQVNLAEIAHTQAARDLPHDGVLSFFCFQDIERDNPDRIGARVMLLPGPAKLLRAGPPKKLSAGNTPMPAARLVFHETLDLPEADGPWADVLQSAPFRDSDEVDGVLERFRLQNFENMLGYARATTGGDPTPNKESRHLILLENSVDCRLHLQIPQMDLQAGNFDAVTLSWVDFD
jgi:uncharacterized protein (TIGR02996 family)